MAVQEKYIHDIENIIIKDSVGTDCIPRLKIWQVVNFFKCPLIGMCLTHLEQIHLLKKAGISYKNKSRFDIHEILVSGTDRENSLSRRIDNLLNCKFCKNTEVLLDLDDKPFMTSFKSAMESGENAAVLWAAAVSTRLSMECRTEIYGDIHMAMHRNADQRMNLERRMAVQQEELNDLRQRLQEETRQRRSLYKELKKDKQGRIALGITIDSLKNEKDKLEQVIAGHSNNSHEVKPIQESQKDINTNDRLQKKLEDLQKQMTALEEKNKLLSVQLNIQVNTNRQFEAEFKTVIDEMTALNRCDEDCPGFDLCKKRILIVGGITRMESLYRNLIEGSGGVFEYHDGYVKRGVKDLEGRLKHADIVLCPVSCNSHAACSMVKHLGKKYKKPVYMLSNSSLSSVSRAIRGNESGKSIIN